MRLTPRTVCYEKGPPTKDGEWDGLVESYYENGQLKTKATYKDDERDGPSEYYYESGQLEWRVIYKDGEWHGLSES